MSAVKYDTDHSFPFQELHLANPTGLQGGAYFSKLNLGEKKVIIQMPKCETKNGIHRTDKKIYTDLKFPDSNETFSEWIRELSTRIKSLIYEKKDIWFQNDMTFDDIEYHWQNILRPYKKNYVLLRCIIKKPRNINRKELVMVYDEDETIISLDDIKSESAIIPLLEITGLKFTRQSFLLEFALKQVMVLNEININKCLISVAKHSPNSQFKQEGSEPSSSLVKLNDTTDLKEKGDVVKVSSSESNEQTYLGNLEEMKDENLDDKENIAAVEKMNVLTEENVVLKIIPSPKDQNNHKDIVEYLEKNVNNKGPADKNVTYPNTLEKKDINEIKLEYPENGEQIALKKPTEVYLAIYKAAKYKAKEAKRAALQAFLEVKRIKNKYILDEIESSDDEFEMDTYG